MDNQENKQPQPINPEPSVQPFSRPEPTSSPVPNPNAVPNPNQAPDPYTPSVTPAWFSGDSATPGAEQPVALAAKPKKKGLFIGLIIAIVLVVLGAGGALAYNFWYQNPEKVITDGIVNAIKAKSIAYTGSMAVTGDQLDVKFEITGRSEGVQSALDAKLTYKYEGREVVLEGAALTDDKGDLYFKVKNLDAIVDQYRSMLGSSGVSTELVDKLVAKLNDQWIKVNADDLKSLSKESGESQKCINDAIKKIDEDASIRSELADTYKKNKFIIIDNKLGSQDGSLGYQLSLDEAAAKAFAKDVKNTQLYKTMQNCDKNFKIDEEEMFKKSEDDAKVTSKVEVWVSRFSHQITKLSGESSMDKVKSVVLFEPVFNATIAPVTAPENSITIMQLKADIEELIQSAMGAASSSSSTYDLEATADSDYEGYIMDSGADSQTDEL